MVLSISPNRTCMHSSAVLRGYSISSQICCNILHLLSTTLGYLLAPGQLVLSCSGYSFFSFVTSAVFMLMHKNLPYCCFKKIIVLQEISGSLHTHQNHTILQILSYLSQFSYFLHKVISQISYTQTQTHTHTSYKKFFIYNSSCSPCGHSYFPQVKLPQHLMDRYPNLCKWPVLCGDLGLQLGHTTVEFLSTVFMQ